MSVCASAFLLVFVHACSLLSSFYFPLSLSASLTSHFHAPSPSLHLKSSLVTRSYVDIGRRGEELSLLVVDQLIRKRLPDIHRHLQNLDVNIRHVLRMWISTMFRVRFPNLTLFLFDFTVFPKHIHYLRLFLPLSPSPSLSHLPNNRTLYPFRCEFVFLICIFWRGGESY